MEKTACYSSIQSECNKYKRLFVPRCTMLKWFFFFFYFKIDNNNNPAKHRLNLQIGKNWRDTCSFTKIFNRSRIGMIALQELVEEHVT
jgi:hypothetical protein